MGHSTLGKVACLLVVIGALNWGLVGLGSLLGNGGWNVVEMLLGSWPVVVDVIYVLVGVSGVYHVFNCKK